MMRDIQGLTAVEVLAQLGVRVETVQSPVTGRGQLAPAAGILAIKAGCGVGILSLFLTLF
jgi:hypothetical protein